MSSRQRATRVTQMTPSLETLSQRERQVLRLLALGHTNREVGELLYISVRTAEFHRASIQRKLGLTARAELVRFALAHQAYELLD